MKRQIQKQKTGVIHTITRIIMLVIAILATIAVIFPALFGVMFLKGDLPVEPFELGVFALPVIIINLTALSFAILYYKKLLPTRVKNSLNFILNFEVSKKIAVIVMVVILTIYISMSFEELFLDEQGQWGDFVRLVVTLEGWPFDSQGAPQFQILVVKNALIKTSEILFQNIKIIPFMSTVGLFVVTYFFTAQLTKKRFAGLVAASLIPLSGTFLRFDTAATYSTFWILFFILSLYLMNKKWALSPISFILSIFSKPLTVSFLPASFFFIYNSKMPAKKKALLTISYLIIVGMLIGALLEGVNVGGNIDTKGLASFDLEEFFAGVGAWAYQLRFNPFNLFFYLPLTVGLILVAKSGIREADSVLVLIGVTFFSAPLLSGFTGYNIFPYRFIPFIIFFAIGVGTLLSTRITRQAAKLHR